jgi:hypothetical protein
MFAHPWFVFAFDIKKYNSVTKMNKFVTNSNLDNLVSIFREYMFDKFKYKIPEDDPSVASIAQKHIHIIAGNSTGRESLQDLNLQVLGVLRKFYLEKMQRSSKPPAHIRDNEVYAGRRVVFNEQLPVDTSIMRIAGTDMNKRMELFSAQRTAEFTTHTASLPPEIEPSLKDKPESSDDFFARVKDFERERTRLEVVPQELNKNLVMIKNNLDNVTPGQYKVKHVVLSFDDCKYFSMVATIGIGLETLFLKCTNQHTILPDNRLMALFEPIVSADATLGLYPDDNNRQISIPSGATEFTIVAFRVS